MDAKPMKPYKDKKILLNYQQEIISLWANDEENKIYFSSGSSLFAYFSVNFALNNDIKASKNWHFDETYF